MKIITTWMYSHKKGDKSRYQLGTKVHDQNVQNYYWRCIICLFESSSRLNSDTRHILFCNREPPKNIDGKDVYFLLEKYRVELHDFETVTRPPDDYYEAWNCQFLVLDIIDTLQKISNKEDIIFILDSDCIFNKPITKELEGVIKRNKCLIYTSTQSPDYRCNGFTLPELKKLAIEYGGLVEKEDFFYHSGEFICCSSSELSRISKIAREAFNKSLERYKYNKPKFNEEAQLLSYVYHRLGYASYTANDYIRRIWTSANYSNVAPNDKNLTIWHLPAEKKRGFVAMFKNIESNEVLFQNPNYFETLFLTPQKEIILRKILRKLLRFSEKILRLHN